MVFIVLWHATGWEDFSLSPSLQFSFAVSGGFFPKWEEGENIRKKSKCCKFFWFTTEASNECWKTLTENFRSNLHQSAFQCLVEELLNLLKNIGVLIFGRNSVRISFFLSFTFFCLHLYCPVCFCSCQNRTNNNFWLWRGRKEEALCLKYNFLRKFFVNNQEFLQKFKQKKNIFSRLERKEKKEKKVESCHRTRIIVFVLKIELEFIEKNTNENILLQLRTLNCLWIVKWFFFFLFLSYLAFFGDKQGERKI